MKSAACLLWSLCAASCGAVFLPGGSGGIADLANDVAEGISDLGDRLNPFHERDT